MDKKTLSEKALEFRLQFNKGQKNWSFAHHFSIFASILCSVAAGAVLQIKEPDYSGVAAVLTTIAAALTAIATAGGFERKWRSNRLSRSDIDCLLIDLEAQGADFDALSVKLKKIIGRHDMEIVKESGVARVQGVCGPGNPATPAAPAAPADQGGGKPGGSDGV